MPQQARTRTNAEWIRLLSIPDDEAVENLRDFLVRVAIVYLARKLPEWSPTEVKSLAEDMAQETSVSILNNLSGFRGDSKFTTWAYQCIIHRTADEIRHSHYRNENVRIDIAEDPMQYLTPLLGNRHGNNNSSPGFRDAENLVERRNILELISGIINALPERQHGAVVGVCLRGVPVADMAQSIGLSPNAFYKLLHDARVKILAGLKAKYLTLGDIYAIFED